MRYLFLFFFVNAILHAKSQQVEVSFYFDFGQSKLSENELERFDSFFKENKFFDLYGIEIIGHADLIGSSDANLALSLERCRFVERLLKGKYGDDLRLELIPKGEQESTGFQDTIRAKDRRVTISFWHQAPPIAKVEPDPQKPPCGGTWDHSCPDTTIIMSTSLTLKMNVCDYRKNKACLNLKDYTKIKNIREANLITETTDRQQLNSAGMFGFETCDGKPLPHPIRMLIPITPCNDLPGMEAYRMMNGRWEKDTSKVKRVEINGVAYYEMQVREPGIHNCDAPKGGGTGKPPQHVFKAKKKYRIIQLHVSGACPMYTQVIYPKRTRNINAYGKQIKKVKWRTCGSQTPDVKITVINTLGDTLIADYRSVRQYEANTTLRKCKTNGGSSKEERRANTIFARRHKVEPEDFRVLRSSSTITRSIQ